MRVSPTQVPHILCGLHFSIQKSVTSFNDQTCVLGGGDLGGEMGEKGGVDEENPPQLNPEETIFLISLLLLLSLVLNTCNTFFFDWYYFKFNPCRIWGGTWGERWERKGEWMKKTPTTQPRRDHILDLSVTPTPSGP